MTREKEPSKYSPKTRERGAGGYVKNRRSCQSRGKEKFRSCIRLGNLKIMQKERGFAWMQALWLGGGGWAGSSSRSAPRKKVTVLVWRIPLHGGKGKKREAVKGTSFWGGGLRGGVRRGNSPQERGQKGQGSCDDGSGVTEGTKTSRINEGTLEMTKPRRGGLGKSVGERIPFTTNEKSESKGRCAAGGLIVH